MLRLFGGPIVFFCLEGRLRALHGTDRSDAQHEKRGPDHGKNPQIASIEIKTKDPILGIQLSSYLP
jgi:hypothetical protein